MSKKYKKKRNLRPAARSVATSRAAAEESRQSVALTVGWMLSLVVTLAAEAIAISAAVAERFHPVQPGEGLTAGITAGNLASLFLFVSLVTGLVTAVLVPVVQRVRVVPPPRAITLAALAAAAIPPVTILFRWLF